MVFFKFILILFFVWSGIIHVQAGALSWDRIMTDRGCGSGAWLMIYDNHSWLQKKLDMPFSPSEIKQAAVEYEVRANPYDPKRKTFIEDADYPWAHWQIKVNGQLILDAPAAAYISKGMHCVEFNAAVLRQGKNIISMGWKPMSEGDRQKGRQFGYVYIGIDKTENEIKRRLMPAESRPRPDNDSIRIRMLVK